MKASVLMVGILCHALLACATGSTKKSEARQPNNQLELSEIVTTAEAGKYCEGVGAGGACLVSWNKASRYCEDRGSHLPTATEYVRYLTQFGIQFLSVEEFNATPGLLELKPTEIVGVPRKDGFYRVACAKNADGSDPTFYMNDFHYRRPAGLPGNHKIWTATSPPGYEQAAHVVYDEWGGGGGLPAEHMKSAKNAFRCAPGARPLN